MGLLVPTSMLRGGSVPGVSELHDTSARAQTFAWLCCTILLHFKLRDHLQYKSELSLSISNPTPHPRLLPIATL